MNNIKQLVEELTNRKMTIATMESCTGGGVANAITSVPGASEILKFSAVTYSNEYKIKMGVSKEIIDKYTVYSMEVAEEMSRNIRDFANSDIGVGITGKINREDKNNIGGDNDVIYISICVNGKFYPYVVHAIEGTRADNKEMIIDYIVDRLLEVLGG